MTQGQHIINRKLIFLELGTTLGNIHGRQYLCLQLL